ncbi:MAG: WG repeat-containing protein [Prevotella sp.]|nr:WG repeat-containing protein [Prevotella sp.]
MATLKIISNKNCNLFVDQELVCEIEANKLYKHEIEVGAYLIDMVPLSDDGIDHSISFDLNIASSDQQLLKRINFEDDEQPVSEFADTFNNPNIIFYNGVALVSHKGKIGYIDQSQKWIVEPQFDEAEHMKYGYALVARTFKEEKKFTFINPKGELCLGMWFDEVINRADIIAIIRRHSELFKIDTSSMSVLDSWTLEGSLFSDRPIAVSKDINNKKICKFIDLNFNVVIDMEFDYVSDFSDSGYAEVEKYGVKRFINKEGEICILNSLEEIEANSKLFMFLPMHNSWGENFDWCGLLEEPNRNNMFFKNLYRLPVFRDGKWGYGYITQDTWGKNIVKLLLEPRFDKFLSDSRNGYVVAKDGNYLCIVNLIDAKYSRGEKKGQYLYGEIGKVLYRQECEEMYPINDFKVKWMDYGGYGGFENIYSFKNIIIKNHGKYGIYTNKGLVVHNCIYDDMYFKLMNKEPEKSFYNDSIIVKIGNNNGLISIDGNTLLETKYSDIFKIGNFWCVKRVGSEKFRLYNSQEGKLFNYEFDEIEYGNFDEKVRCDGIETSGHNDYFIKNNSKYGIVSGDGFLLVNCIYDSIKYFDNQYEVTMNNKKGIISANGKSIVPCEYDRIEGIMDGSSGLADGYYVHKGNFIGAFSYNGVKMLDCKYDSIIDDSLYEHNIFTVFSKYKCALFNGDKFVTDFIFDYIGKEMSSYYKVSGDKYFSFFHAQINNKWGIIDENGKYILDCKYEDIGFYSQYCTSDKSPIFDICINGFHGIVSKHGKSVIPAIYEKIIPKSSYDYDVCSIDSYVVKKNGLYGILTIKRNGDNSLISDIQYSAIDIRYSRNKEVLGYKIQKNGLYGFLDNNGKILIDCKFDDIEPEEDRNKQDTILLYIVKTNNKKGAIDNKGKVIVPCKYDNCFCDKVDNKHYLCYNDKLSDKSGKETNDSGTPCQATEVISKKTYQLKTTDIFYAKYELERLNL